MSNAAVQSSISDNWGSPAIYVACKRWDLCMEKQSVNDAAGIIEQSTGPYLHLVLEAAPHASGDDLQRRASAIRCEGAEHPLDPRHHDVVAHVELEANLKAVHQDNVASGTETKRGQSGVNLGSTCTDLP